jgi:hypothetical protein
MNEMYRGLLGLGCLGGIGRGFTDVLIDPSGEVVEVEEEVALPSLPPKVSEGLQKKAGSGKIAKVESLRKRGILVAYEAQVRTGNRHSEAQVGPKGETVAHPE